MASKAVFTVRISKDGTFRWNDSRIKASKPSATTGVQFCQVVAATALEIGADNVTVGKTIRARKRRKK